MVYTPCGVMVSCLVHGLKLDWKFVSMVSPKWHHGMVSFSSWKQWTLTLKSCDHSFRPIRRLHSVKSHTSLEKLWDFMQKAFPFKEQSCETALLKIVTYIIICHKMSQGFPKSMSLIGCASCNSPFWTAQSWICWTIFDMFKLIVLCNRITINCDDLRCLEHNIQWLLVIHHTFNKTRNCFQMTHLSTTILTHQSAAFHTARVVTLFSLHQCQKIGLVMVLKDHLRNQ